MAESRDESFWDYLTDVSRLQDRMGKDMVAWAQVYEAAGQAMQGNAETAALMADVGRRGERMMRSGPSSAARQAMQLFFNPMQAMGVGAMPAVPPASGPNSPFARLWESWASAMPNAGGYPPSGQGGQSGGDRDRSGSGS